MKIPENCMQCEHHTVIDDSDPNDRFCYDDQAVVCNLTKENPNFNSDSAHEADRQNKRCVTVSCRPHKLERECARPHWCPLMIQPTTLGKEDEI